MKILENMKTIKTRTEIPKFLKDNCLNNNICEVGVRFGYNFQQLIASDPKLAVAIDHYLSTDNPAEQDTGMEQGRLDQVYKELFLRFLDEPSVKLIRENSRIAVKLFPLYYFDYVYIDADHSYKGCLEDIRLWWPRVRQGGVLAGHDYIDTQSQNGVEFGVIQAVKTFMEEMKIDAKYLHSTEMGYKSWLIYKQDGE